LRYPLCPFAALFRSLPWRLSGWNPASCFPFPAGPFFGGTLWKEALASLMKATMFRLAHLSDAHLGPLPDVTYRELASKRAVGYINWQRNRRRHMHDSVIDTIVADVRASGADHIAVTGDLVNLALDG